MVMGPMRLTRSFSLDLSTFQRLQAAKDRSRRSQSEIVEAALLEYLPRLERVPAAAADGVAPAPGVAEQPQTGTAPWGGNG